MRPSHRSTALQEEGLHCNARHAAASRERFADCIEGFIDRGVDEPAGVDHDEVGGFVGRRDLVAFGAQLREDALRVDERLGTAEAHEADLGRAMPGKCTRGCPAAGTLACTPLVCWHLSPADYSWRGTPLCAAALAGAAAPLLWWW